MSACVPTTICASPDAISCRTIACSLRAERARQQRDADAERRAQLVDGEEVLLGERLRRRHQRSLPAEPRPRGGAHAARRPSSPTRPRPGGAAASGTERSRSASISADRALLVRGERERERRAVARDELARRAQRLRRGALARGRRSSEREPEDEQLVEGEPHPPDLGLRERARAMDERQRVRSSREAFRCEQRRRKIVTRRRAHARAPAA